MPERLPHHLAHDMIAEVGGEVTNSPSARLAHRRTGLRLAVDVLRAAAS
jgi:hypothetical protein